MLGGLIGSALYAWLLMRQRSSTAGIGILALPLVFAAAATGSTVLAICLREVIRAFSRPPAGSRIRAAIAAVVLIAAGMIGVRTAIRAERLQRLQSDEATAAVLMASVEPALAGHDYLALAAIASNDHTPASALMKLASSADPGLHRKRRGLIQLLDRDAMAVMRKLLRNPSLPPEAIPLIARSEDMYVLGDVAMNPATPVTLLRKLSDSHDSYLIRWGLAWNPATPDEILESLAAGENTDDEVIQRHLAQNRSAPQSVLTQLAAHPDPFVRRAVARNPSTPHDSLRRLTKDQVEEVRFYLAINDACPIDVFETLSHDTSERVQRYARERIARLAPSP